MGMIELIDVPLFSEADGKLCVFESNMIPGFSVKRVFCVFDVPEHAVRANHACMNALVLLYVIHGSVKVSAEYDGIIEEYELKPNKQGLLLPEKSWIKAYNFSDEAVLICLSNKKYQDCEYIDDYDEYRKRMEK